MPAGNLQRDEVFDLEEFLCGRLDSIQSNATMKQENLDANNDFKKECSPPTRKITRSISRELAAAGCSNIDNTSNKRKQETIGGLSKKIKIEQNLPVKVMKRKREDMSNKENRSPQRVKKVVSDTSVNISPSSKSILQAIDNVSAIIKSELTENQMTSDDELDLGENQKTSEERKESSTNAKANEEMELDEDSDPEIQKIGEDKIESVTTTKVDDKMEFDEDCEPGIQQSGEEKIVRSITDKIDDLMELGGYKVIGDDEIKKIGEQKKDLINSQVSENDTDVELFTESDDNEVETSDSDEVIYAPSSSDAEYDDDGRNKKIAKEVIISDSSSNSVDSSSVVAKSSTKWQLQNFIKKSAKSLDSPKEEDIQSTSRSPTGDLQKLDDEHEDESSESSLSEVDNQEDSDVPPQNPPDLGLDLNIKNMTFKGQRIRDLGDKSKETYHKERVETNKCLEHLHKGYVSAPHEVPISKDPVGLKVKLMHHQRCGINWMKHMEAQKPPGGILADDMGLGKTLQIIGLVLLEKNEKKEKKKRTREDDSDSSDSDDDFEEEDFEEQCKNSRKIYDGRTLIVCPASVTKQWEKEVMTKCKRNTLSVYIYHGTDKYISERRLAKYDFVITTYHLLAKEYELHVLPKEKKDSRLFKIHWERSVLDEAHYIRNRKTKFNEAACNLRTKVRWALTGTPIQNSEEDFFALLKYLEITPFNDYSMWRRWVSNDTSGGNTRLHALSKTKMLRRTKDELNSKGLIEELPEREADIVYVDLNDNETLIYKKILLYSRSFFYDYLRQKKDRKDGYYPANRNFMQQEIPERLSKAFKIMMRQHTQKGDHVILTLILRLRQMCCHPSLIKAMIEKEDREMIGDDVEKPYTEEIIGEIDKLISESDEDSDDEEDVEDTLEAKAKKLMSRSNPIYSLALKSSKVEAILKSIKEVVEKNEKVIVVSQWTSHLEIISHYLDEIPNAKHAVFSGKMDISQRQYIIDRLNDRRDKFNVLLLSLCAGAVGLNLTGANHLFLVDLHWNPQLERQAQDRIYRMGQKKHVHIHKFVCRDTIEEKVLILQKNKLKIAESILSGTVSKKLSLEDFCLLFS